MGGTGAQLLYDALNNLTALQKSSGESWTFAYDGGNNLTGEVFNYPNSAGSVASSYLRDLTQPLPSLLQTVQTPSGLAGASTVTTTYIYGFSGAVAEWSNGKDQPVLNDAQGSVRQERNGHATTASQNYDAYGNQLAGSEAAPGIGYAGGQTDMPYSFTQNGSPASIDTTALYFLHARVYDPASGNSSSGTAIPSIRPTQAPITRTPTRTVTPSPTQILVVTAPFAIGWAVWSRSF